MDLKTTALHSAHVALGAKMVPFAGYEMPVSYSGIIEEHTAVREAVGIFDVSHMGEFFVRGPGAIAAVNRLVTNDCSRLASDGVLYTVMCREDGTAVDDLLVTRLADDEVMIVVNAANIAKDYAHMSEVLAAAPEDVELVDRSEDFGLLAVQGPKALAVLAECPSFAGVKEKFEATPYYRYFQFDSDGDNVVVSRTGYTGERGFEIFVPAARARKFWDEILRHGESHGIQPVGLAARDTLRFEAAFCLYGHELDDHTTPLQAGLGWVVKFKKDDYVGKSALRAEKKSGLPKVLIGLELEGRNIARQGFEVLVGNEVVGRVTSGTFSPTLQKSLALAYVEGGLAERDAFSVQVRKKLVDARRVDLPFYPSRAR